MKSFSGYAPTFRREPQFVSCMQNRFPAEGSGVVAEFMHQLPSIRSDTMRSRDGEQAGQT